MNAGEIQHELNMMGVDHWPLDLERMAAYYNPTYPWHRKTIPCPNWGNCFDDDGHELCHNCNPLYVERLNCVTCNRPSNGGRWLCCNAATCVQCFHTAPSCDACGSENKGYFKNHEVPAVENNILTGA
jgi:hypothetical protein